MASKREAKKKEYMEKILEAAYKVFSESSYESATMDQIAKAAGVGTGTAYLYFKSKAELFKLTMEETIGTKQFYNLFDHIDYDKDVIYAIDHVMAEAIHTLCQLDCLRLRELIFSMNYEAVDQESFIYKFILNVDNELKDKLTMVLGHYKDVQKLKQDFDTEVCATIILNSFIQAFLAYVMVSAVDQEAMIRQMQMQIHFILKPYIVEE